MEGLGVCSFKRTVLLAFEGQLGLTIPSLVRRDLAARWALRKRPLEATTRTNAACPEGVPQRRTARNALPTILGLRPVLALRTEDLLLAGHKAPNVDMSGGPKGAKRPLERPLDGGVRRHCLAIRQKHRR